jgi:hypothetical protein
MQIKQRTQCRKNVRHWSAPHQLNRTAIHLCHANGVGHIRVKQGRTLRETTALDQTFSRSRTETQARKRKTSAMKTCAHVWRVRVNQMKNRSLYLSTKR